MKTRNPKLKVLLRVEGSGDKNEEYPKMAADPEKRSTFIRSVTSFLEVYNFDGLDIYWNVPQTEDKVNWSRINEIQKFNTDFPVIFCATLKKKVFYSFLIHFVCVIL